MASKAYRPCAHPGCRVLVRSGYCDAHRPNDRSRRCAEAADWHRWYTLPIWVNDLRPTQLLREPFCRECAARARRDNRPELLRVKATDVDHVKPHRGNWRIFTDRTNLQSLCHSCHSRKTMAEMNENRQLSRR